MKYYTTIQSPYPISQDKIYRLKEIFPLADIQESGIRIEQGTYKIDDIMKEMKK